MNESNVTVANEDLLSRRLQEALEQAQLTERSVFALTAEPSPSARLPTLFAGSDAALVKNFNNPPRLRHAGFDLEHGGTSRIVRGDLRRALVQGWKVLDLWRDGTLIYAVDAAVQPCWGNPAPGGGLRVNPLALSEPIYLFGELSRLVYEESTVKPKRVVYRVFFRRLIAEGIRARLSDGPLDPVFFESGSSHTAPDSEMEREVTWEQEGIEPAALAYRLVKEVYNWFEISDDGIPYARKLATGMSVIDREALLKAGKPLAPGLS